MSLFRLGWFTAASGSVLPWKVECDSFIDDDWLWAADEIARIVDFRDVEGVPTGGLQLANLLAPLGKPSATSLLIVDDVLTTGGSMEQQRAGRDAVGFVVFARGPLPSWVRALWTFTGDHN